MAVYLYEELFAWQLADRFKKEVFRIVQGSLAAERDFKYRGQIVDSASAVSKDIAEGFERHSPADLMRFIDYALGSLAEARDRLRDGIELQYFPASECEMAFRLAKRCKIATRRLKYSQRRYLEQRRDAANEARKQRAPRKGKEPEDEPPRA